MYSLTHSHKIIDTIPLAPDHSGKKFKIKLPNICPICDTAYGELPLISYYVEEIFDEFLYSFFYHFFILYKMFQRFLYAAP